MDQQAAVTQMSQLDVELKGGSKLNADDLAEILARYTEVTASLQDSHAKLQSEVRRLREELARKNTQLERRKRLAALGEMAAGLAHEIRNPLGGIQLYAGLLRKDLQDRPALLKVVEKIISGVQLLDRLVNDVLSLAQTVQLQTSQVDVAQIVRSTVELVRPKLAESSVQLVADLPDEIPAVMGDRNMLSRALLNLVLNAVEAAGVEGKVQVRIVTERHWVRIEVIDSGPGVPPQLLDKIFNPFFTTKDCGTGLGLAMVHRIAEAHEGGVSVSNLPQGGACFVLSLPYRQGGPSRQAVCRQCSV